MRELRASVLVDVNVEQELSLQLSDLLFGVGATLPSACAGLCGQGKKS